MIDTALLVAQTAATGFLAAWMFTGVKDNWLHPDLNGAVVGVILRIEKMQLNFPQEYAQIKHRRVESDRVHRAIFWLIVLWETLALIVLVIATVAMGLALVGVVSPDIARSLALMGVLLFTSVWAGFLIFGNHWVYWYCHEWGQNSHFQLLLWGLSTLIFLAIG